MGQSNTKLNKSDLEFISQNSNFSKNEVEKLYQDFKKNDKDSNGLFDRNEFVCFFKSKFTNYPEDQLNKLFDAFDTDKSGSICFKELVVALSVISKGTAEDKLSVLFDIYDEDKNGSLDGSEITNMINVMVQIGVSIGRPENDIKLFITSLLNKIDTDKSKSISRDEWIKEGSRSPSLLTLLVINRIILDFGVNGHVLECSTIAALYLSHFGCIIESLSCERKSNNKQQYQQFE